MTNFGGLLAANVKLAVELKRHMPFLHRHFPPVLANWSEMLRKHCAFLICVLVTSTVVCGAGK